MTRQSTARRRVFSASNCLAVVGDALADIKREDELTYADLGRVLGRGDDSAAKYCDGQAEMGLVAFLLAWREYNGRFIGPIKRFVEETRPLPVDDRACESTVLKAGLALSVALEDGHITVEEVRANRHTLEAARDAIDAQLGKLRPAGEVA